MKIEIISGTLILPLLLSAGTFNVQSNITGQSMSSEVVQRVIFDGTDSQDIKTNASSTAMNVAVDYEFYKMGHGIMYTSWSETYALIYRIKVDLKTSVKWKDGWWIFASTHTNDTFLSNIQVTLNMTSLPSDFKVIRNYSKINTLVATYFDGYSDVYHAGNYGISYNGGYGINMYTFEEGKPNYNLTNSFYLTNADISNESRIHISTGAYYDVLKNGLYSNREVCLYGGFLFTGNSDPTGTSIKVDVNGGLKETDQSISRGTETKSLGKYGATALIEEGYQPINTTYGYGCSFSKTYVLN